MSSTDSTATTVEPTPVDLKRHEYIRGLRDLADFLDERPEVDVSELDTAARVFWYVREDELADAARTLGRAEKTADESYVKLERRFGPHVVQAYTAHEGVCERVVVGTETVTREVPDPELVAEVPTITVTEEREIVEWRCPPSLLAERES